MATPSLFDPAGAADLRRRLAALTPDLRPLWGRMDAAQMLAHCQVPLQVALGDRRLPRSLLGRLLGALVRRSAVGPAPFRRGLPTDRAFVVDGPRDFAAEHARLLALLARFAEGGAAALSTDPHPFFGRLTPAQWDTLMAKHLDHHLRQFGS